MSSSSCCSTPAASVANFGAVSTSTPQLNNTMDCLKILDQVSRMTLEEPQAPDEAPGARNQTPMLRKRKPIFVTPPRGPSVARSLLEVAANSSQRRGTRLPMMPDSLELNSASNHNPYTRHKALHSPVTRISSINMDFISMLQEIDDDPAIPTFRFPSRTQATTLNFVLGDCFPNLEDDEPPPSRVLKMRRKRREDYPVFEADL
jgi:hypothetical protein